MRPILKAPISSESLRERSTKSATFDLPPLPTSENPVSSDDEETSVSPGDEETSEEDAEGPPADGAEPETEPEMMRPFETLEQKLKWTIESLQDALAAVHRITPEAISLQPEETVRQMRELESNLRDSQTHVSDAQFQYRLDRYNVYQVLRGDEPGTDLTREVAAWMAKDFELFDQAVEILDEESRSGILAAMKGFSDDNAIQFKGEFLYIAHSKGLVCQKEGELDELKAGWEMVYEWDEEALQASVEGLVWNTLRSCGFESAGRLSDEILSYSDEEASDGYASDDSLTPQVEEKPDSSSDGDEYSGEESGNEIEGEEEDKEGAERAPDRLSESGDEPDEKGSASEDEPDETGHVSEDNPDEEGSEGEAEAEEGAERTPERLSGSEDEPNEEGGVPGDAPGEEGSGSEDTTEAGDDTPSASEASEDE